jgi:thiol-disulfide isomerase/thioredoxin
MLWAGDITKSSFPGRLLYHVRPLPVLLFVGVAVLSLSSLVACLGAERASDFQVALFDGGEFRLAEEAGRSAVVINFWYPSCPPCRAEMPAFQQAWEQLGGHPVRFVGLFVPQGLDSEQDARDFVQELALSYDFATDRGVRVARDYEIKYFPTTVFIDRSGDVFKREIGTLDKGKITRIVRNMAGSQAGSASR